MVGVTLSSFGLELSRMQLRRSSLPACTSACLRWAGRQSHMRQWTVPIRHPSTSACRARCGPSLVRRGDTLRAALGNQKVGSVQTQKRRSREHRTAIKGNSQKFPKPHLDLFEPEPLHFLTISCFFPSRYPFSSLQTSSKRKNGLRRPSH